MIYIKYISKKDPSRWLIYGHEKGAKVETKIIDSDGSTYPYIEPFNLKIYRIFNLKIYRTNWKIKYLTQKEIDLLKLELL